MTVETIDHTTLTNLAEAGSLRDVRVVGQTGGWAVVVKFGLAERILTVKLLPKKIRIFRKFETLVEYLKGLGITQFDVDALNYDPCTIVKRPDKSAVMKDAHAAASYLRKRLPSDTPK